ncbi:unnamed protein product [Rotaria sp. Silwood1]|nr:unnamed protein product [Rotaria sp. Silwood1]
MPRRGWRRATAHAGGAGRAVRRAAAAARGRDARRGAAPAGVARYLRHRRCRRRWPGWLARRCAHGVAAAAGVRAAAGVAPAGAPRPGRRGGPGGAAAPGMRTSAPRVGAGVRAGPAVVPAGPVGRRQQVHRRDRAQSASPAVGRAGAGCDAAAGRGRRSVGAAHRGRVQQRPLREPGDELPAAAAGEPPGAGVGDDKCAGAHRFRLHAALRFRHSVPGAGGGQCQGAEPPAAAGGQGRGRARQGGRHRRGHLREDEGQGRGQAGRAGRRGVGHLRPRCGRGHRADEELRRRQDLRLQAASLPEHPDRGPGALGPCRVHEEHGCADRPRRGTGGTAPGRGQGRGGRGAGRDQGLRDQPAGQSAGRRQGRRDGGDRPLQGAGRGHREQEERDRRRAGAEVQGGVRQGRRGLEADAGREQGAGGRLPGEAGGHREGAAGVQGQAARPDQEGHGDHPAHPGRPHRLPREPDRGGEGRLQRLHQQHLDPPEGRFLQMAAGAAGGDGHRAAGRHQPDVGVQAGAGRAGHHLPQAARQGRQAHRRDGGVRHREAGRVRTGAVPGRRGGAVGEGEGRPGHAEGHGHRRHPGLAHRDRREAGRDQDRVDVQPGRCHHSGHHRDLQRRDVRHRKGAADHGAGRGGHQLRPRHRDGRHRRRHLVDREVTRRGDSRRHRLPRAAAGAVGHQREDPGLHQEGAGQGGCGHRQGDRQDRRGREEAGGQGQGGGEGAVRVVETEEGHRRGRQAPHALHRRQRAIGAGAGGQLAGRVVEDLAEPAQAGEQRQGTDQGRPRGSDGPGQEDRVTHAPRSGRRGQGPAHGRHAWLVQRPGRADHHHRQRRRQAAFGHHLRRHERVGRRRDGRGERAELRASQGRPAG